MRICHPLHTLPTDVQLVMWPDGHILLRIVGKASSMLYPSMNSFTRWTADGSFYMARNCTMFGCRRCALIPTSDTIKRNICPFPCFGILIVFTATSESAQCPLRTVSNAPCPNVCINVQLLHAGTNSCLAAQCRLGTVPNAPCPNVCIDVQLLHAGANSCLAAQCRLGTVPNAPCPNVCAVSMFNSSTLGLIRACWHSSERSLSQCMCCIDVQLLHAGTNSCLAAQCRLGTVPNAPCPNVCIDVQLLHAGANSCLAAQCRLGTVPNAPCPNVCAVSMFNSSTLGLIRALLPNVVLAQFRTLFVPVYVLYRCSTPPRWD